MFAAHTQRSLWFLPLLQSQSEMTGKARVEKWVITGFQRSACVCLFNAAVDWATARTRVCVCQEKLRVNIWTGQTIDELKNIDDFYSFKREGVFSNWWDDGENHNERGQGSNHEGLKGQTGRREIEGQEWIIFLATSQRLSFKKEKKILELNNFCINTLIMFAKWWFINKSFCWVRLFPTKNKWLSWAGSFQWIRSSTHRWITESVRAVINMWFTRI